MLKLSETRQWRQRKGWIHTCCISKCAGGRANVSSWKVNLRLMSYHILGASEPWMWMRWRSSAECACVCVCVCMPLCVCVRAPVKAEIVIVLVFYRLLATTMFYVSIKSLKVVLIPAAETLSALAENVPVVQKLLLIHSSSALKAACASVSH